MKRTATTAKSKHPYGTYAEAATDEKTNEILFEFIKKYDIPNPVSDFHCTVVYSRTPAPTYEKYKVTLPIIAKITEFKVFEQEDGKKALVVCLDAPELNRAHYDALEHHGASYDYIQYIPHITLSYDYTSKTLPKNLPVCDPTFVKFTVKPLKRN